MTRFIFRILLVGLGLFLTYTFGKEALQPFEQRATGVCVQGRISGFLAGRNAPSVQREPDGVRKGKRRARRPVYVYPTAPGSRDSLEARSSTSATILFGNYDLNDRVTVVFDRENPANAHIWGFQVIAIAFVLVLFGLYMIRLGVLWRA
jgi:hypothetical protein